MKLGKLITRAVAIVATALASSFAFADPITPAAKAADNVTAINNALSAAGQGGTVELGEGTFEINATLSLANGVTLKGQGWEKTIIKQTEWGKRCVLIDGGSTLTGVTLTGGQSFGNYEQGSGAGAQINDGTISWCCISNNWVASGNNAYGAGVLINKGRIDHSIIAYNRGGNYSVGGGIGAYDTSGPIVIDTCLVYGNTAKDNAGGIGFNQYNADVTIRNTTITANTSEKGNGGVYVNSTKFVAVNTIIFGNTVGGTENNTSSKLAASSSNNLIGVDPKFADAANGDFRLTSSSKDAVGKGVWYEGIVDDLDGVQFGNPPSIGCYEFYIPTDKVLQPEFDPVSGTTFCSPIKVTLTCATDGAAIRYTTDGNDPTAESELYENPIGVSVTTTIKARAYKSGLTESDVVAATYTYEMPEPPVLGEVTVTPKAKKALFAGTIASVGNLDATACDIYLALDGGQLQKVASDVTDSFGFAVSDLTAATTYAYTLVVSNNATVAMGVETSGSFTTAEFDPGIEPGANAAETTKKIQDAVNEAAKELPVGTVDLSEGLFEINATLDLKDGVTLVGRGWEKTVIRQTASRTRCITIDGGAKLEGVTLTGGSTNGGWDNGSGAGAKVNDGTVSWCCISNNFVYGNNVCGGGVNLLKGTIDHSIVAFNQAGQSGSKGGGIGCGDGNGKPTGAVVIDTCLIYGNTTSVNDGNGDGGGVCFDAYGKDVTIRNTTIVGNTATKANGGLSVSGGTGKGTLLVNTIVSGNKVGESENNTGSTFLSVSSNNLIGGDPKFVDAANGDFHLTEESPAVGTGVTYAGIGKDLDGYAFKATPSIGCYEFGAMPTVETPTFDPAGMAFTEPIEVALSCATEGATIRYTVNGGDPTEESEVYESPIPLTGSATIKACAFLAGMNPSEIAAATYTYEGPRIGVTSSSEPYGTVDPGYGDITAPEKDREYVFTCTEDVAVLVEGVRQAVCTGWKLLDIDSGALIRSSADQGEQKLRCAYVYEQGRNVKIEWQWMVQDKVAVDATPGGTVVPSGDAWLCPGDVVRAVPDDADHAFYRWVDGEGKTLSREAEFVVPSPVPTGLKAEFSQLYWVATTGKAGAAGTEDDPFSTLEEALAHTRDGATVKVCAGTYEIPPSAGSRLSGSTTIPNGIPSYWLTNAVHVIGVDGPEVTVLDGLGKNNRFAFILDNAEACVEGVTVRNVLTSVPYQVRESPVFEVKNGTLVNCVACDMQSLNYVGAINLRLGTVSGCRVSNVRTGDSASLGAGINRYDGDGVAVITNCIIENCTAKQGAGMLLAKPTKVYGCVIRGCTVEATNRDQHAPLFVSHANVTVENCVITNNCSNGTKEGGGGVQMTEGVVRNCLIADNVCTDKANGGGVMIGGGTLECCTVVGNAVNGANGAKGDGVCQTGGDIRNCIVAMNGAGRVLANAANHDKTGGTCTYTCTYPSSVAGAGNVYADPMFADLAGGDYRLSDYSPLFDIGQNQSWMETATDLDGSARIEHGTVNPGCYETPTPAVRPLTCSFVANVVEGGRPLAVAFTSTVNNPGDTVAYAWTFGDGAESDAANPSHTYEATGVYDVQLVVTSEGRVFTNRMDRLITVGTPVAYVSNSGSGVWPYDTPETATNDVNEALRCVYACGGACGRLVFRDGVYSPTEVLRLSRPNIRLECENGPGRAVLDGSRLNTPVDGLVSLEEATVVVDGLVLTNCYAASGAQTAYGSALTISAGVATNCTIANCNSGSWTLGALHMTGGTFTHGTIRGCNSADPGTGGGGRAGFYVNGASAKLLDTVVSGNTAKSVAGGQIVSGLIANCKFLANVLNGDEKATVVGVLQVGGGTVRNCLIADNIGARVTSGVNVTGAGTLENCTIAGNRTEADDACSGLLVGDVAATVRNVLVWGNTGSATEVDTGAKATVTTCLFDTDPHFRGPRNWHIRTGSPAQNAGTNADWMNDATDLDGKPRILDGTVDIGCYERAVSGLLLMVK